MPVPRLLLLLVALVCAATPAVAQQEQAPPPERLEYALVTVESLTTGLHIRHTRDGVNVRASFYDFYVSLGGTKERPAVTTTDILDLLGRDAWELVSVRDHLHDFAVSYYFKRPLRD